MKKLFNLEFENVDYKDFPNFSDAFITYAEYEDGTPLTQAELENREAGDFFDEMYQSLI
tara:strand:+ start:435 stop:611 length:177 start_codon:yes stop_codon:yes gene_type:complete